MMWVVGGVVVLAGLAFALLPRQTTPVRESEEGVHAFSAKDIDGKTVKLSQFKGKALVIVNVASRCGLTRQYEALEQLFREHQDEGLVVLGFPANQFAGQEPGTEAEIKEFCQTKFGVTFPMFSKIEVKGPGAHPLYQYLVGATENKNDIEWNFAKFVVGRDGKVVGRFSPQTLPSDPKFMAAVEAALRG